MVCKKKNRGPTPLEIEHQERGRCTLHRPAPLTGFTLIELLVVIAIIGVLSSVVLASLNTARAKARNASRLANANQYMLALEFAYDANGRYPVSNTTYVCLGDYTTNNCWGGFYSENSTVNSEISPYIRQLPTPPTDNIPYTGYVYHSCPGTYCTTGQQGQLHWFMEGTNSSCGRATVITGNYNSTGTTYCALYF
jgi:prepilin-type N-terminal cleavage/methylation domain-containing protein